MSKSESDVIKDFNEVVNMSADELETFLKTSASETTGWTKDGSGESVGHESGRKIVDIFKRNPSKDASKYTDADKEHMRKVVAYCKRHLAQENHLKETKGPEELENSKSTRSLKNWGHDPMKTIKGDSEKPAFQAKLASKKDDKPVSKGKPASQKEENPVSRGKPASKKEDKPVSKRQDKPVTKKDDKTVSKKEDKKEENPASQGKPTSKRGKADVDGEIGEKRAAEKPESGKPPSKKAKTDKPPSEGTRKPPSRGAKKVQ